MKRTVLFGLSVLAGLGVLMAGAPGALAVTLPYFEDFESEPTCGTSCQTACVLSTTGWTNAVGEVANDTDWTVDANGTSSSTTGPSGDHTMGSGRYLYIETSSPCYPDFEAHLISPPLDLAGTTTPAIAFWYHMYGATMGMLHVDVSTDGGMTWTNDVVPAWTDNANLWQRTPDIDLGAYLGQIVHVRIRGVSGTSFTGDVAIDDFMAFEPVPNDLGIHSVQTGGTGCNVTADTISVTIVNYGNQPQTGFDIHYILDGGPPVVETYNGPPIPAYGLGLFTFATPADVSAPGQHDIVAFTVLAGDAEPANDSSTGAFWGAPGVVTTFPHLEDFEQPGSWDATGTNSTWERGTPANAVLSSAYSGQNAWVTSLNANYANNEHSYLRSLCGYDFSTLTNPAVRLAVWWEAEFSWDGAVLQSSADGGLTWTNVGAFGDGHNWYTDSTLNAAPAPQEGWTGRTNSSNGSGGWVLATHQLDGLAGEPSVLLRVAFHSDGIINDEGFAVDDIYVFDNTSEIHVTQLGPEMMFSAVPVDATQVLVQHFSVEAWGAADLDTISLTLTQTGTLADADIVGVTIWLDDGDRQFDPALDVALGTEPVSGGAVVFTNIPLFTAPLWTPEDLLVTVDLAGTATGGETFGFEIAQEADLTPVLADPVVFNNAPIRGPSFAVYGPAAMLPWSDALGTAPAANRMARVLGDSTWPTATAAGSTVSATTLSGSPDAWVGLVSEATPSGEAAIGPHSPATMAAIAFPAGATAGAIDYDFDLAMYAAASDLLWLRFAWNNTHEEDSDLDNVFLSADGGLTWVVSLYRFPFATPVAPGWQVETVDVSAALLAAGVDFSGDVRIRFQAGGNMALGDDGLLVDDVWLGVPQWLQVERSVGVLFTSNDTDDMGQVALGAQNLTYTVTNVGHLPLSIDTASFASSGETNVSGVSITPPVDATLVPGATTTFAVDFTADAVGPFTLNLDFATGDPRLPAGFNLTVLGEGIVPEIDLQRPAGTSLADGSTDDVGTVAAGEAQTLTYTIANTGLADLSLTGTPPDLVLLQSESNVSASVSTQPAAALVAPASTDTFEVTYTVAAEGAFSFEVVVPNDDTDEGSYTLTVSGTGEIESQPDGGTGSDGGTDPGNGKGGCGCQSSVGQLPGSLPLGHALLLLLTLGFLLHRRQRAAR